MTRIACLLVLVALGINTHMAAQDKKKKKEEEVPVYNYVIDDPMDAFHAMPDSPKKPAASIAYYTVPEFYHHTPWKIRDTTYEFLCYDHRDTLIPNVEDYDAVRFFSLFKKFDDSLHTYTDQGVKKPLPVSLIVKRYDHIGTDKWISVEYPGNKFIELKEFKDVIVRTDTQTVAAPIAGQPKLKIYNYYKVIKN